MKVEKIDHVSIQVRDLEKAMKWFSDVLGMEFVEPFTEAEEIREEMDIIESMSSVGISLVAPLTPNGTTAKLIERRGETVSMISFKVPNLEEAIAHMQSKGIRMIMRGKIFNAKWAEFHPKDCYGIMMELIEYEPKHPLLSTAPEP